MEKPSCLERVAGWEMRVLFEAGEWVWESLRRLFLKKCLSSLDLKDEEELPQG